MDIHVHICWRSLQLDHAINLEHLGKGGLHVSLADRLANVVPEKAQCITCRWLAGLPERDQEAFAQLASRADISHAQLHRLCKEEGLPCSESAFKRHLQNCSGRESR